MNPLLGCVPSSDAHLLNGAGAQIRYELGGSIDVPQRMSTILRARLRSTSLRWEVQWTCGRHLTKLSKPTRPGVQRRPAVTAFGDFPELSVDIDSYIATVEIQRPPHNYFSLGLIQSLSHAFETLDNEPSCRVIVLASQGKSFCAGAQLGGPTPAEGEAPPPGGMAGRTHLYYEAVRLFRTETPFVAAVQGAAIGGGLGLALSADFRIASSESRFASNFARLGFHHGFGLTVLLPELIGKQAAANMLMTGRRGKGRRGSRARAVRPARSSGRYSNGCHRASRRDRGVCSSRRAFHSAHTPPGPGRENPRGHRSRAGRARLASAHGRLPGRRPRDRGAPSA